MKVRPEILLNYNEQPSYNKILVTGTDESLINYVRDYIIKDFKKKNFFVNTSGTYNKNLTGDLFSDKKTLFLLKEYSFKNKDLENIDFSNQSFLIISNNNKKTNMIRGEFAKSKNDLVVECYPLNKKSKETALKEYVNKNNINISNNIFWYIVESFDNQYVLFIKQLETLKLLQKKIESVDEVERAVFVENKIDLSKIFFHVLKKNSYLINIFNKNIYSQNDFYIFLNSLKVQLEIIASSDSKEEALLKFPRYLFGEKDVFIKIYNLLNKEKILKIYKNISKIESLVRKNSSLYNVVGLRFLLNTKKIIAS